MSLVTTVGGTTSDSYATLAEAEAYMATLIYKEAWTAAAEATKEAALKAVKLGLTVDTRRVECQFDLDQPAAGTWAPLKVTYTPAAHASAAMHGWWSLRDGFVLTIVGPDEIAM